MNDRRISRGRRWRGSSSPRAAHDEGGERRFSTETLEFHGDEVVERIVVRDAASSETLVMSADLILIAAGFVGPELDESRSRER